MSQKRSGSINPNSSDNKGNGSQSNKVPDGVSNRLDLTGIDRSALVISRPHQTEEEREFTKRHSEYQSAAVAYILDHFKTVRMLALLEQSTVAADVREAMAAQVKASTIVRLQLLTSEEQTITRDAAGAPQAVTTALRSANVVMAAKLILAADTEALLRTTVAITWVLLRDRLNFITHNFEQLRSVLKELYELAGEEMPELNQQRNRAEKQLSAALAAESIASA